MSSATITRRFDRWAYPRNGNLDHPTPYFRWEVAVDGQVVLSWASRLSEARVFLHDYYGIDHPVVVRDRLPPNPYSQSVRNQG